jgi:putative RNA 2'-phosphotransferase
VAPREASERPVSSTSLSKKVAHALRHDPKAYGLRPDSEGWVPVDDLLAALRARGSAWAAVQRADVERMLASSSKRRFELSGGQIRALYGHSLAGRIARAPELSPPVLFHGTAPSAWCQIQLEGLRPMRRQFVHLSSDTTQALAVGRRKHPEPLILHVDAAGAQAAGISFYPGNDVVWLAEHVPPDFVSCLRP